MVGKKLHAVVTHVGRKKTPEIIATVYADISVPEKKFQNTFCSRIIAIFFTETKMVEKQPRC